MARGRKSAAALAVVTSLPGQRPEPPEELTEDQAEEWRAIVGRMPAEWFTRETHGFLVAYCRHVITARRVTAQIEAFSPEWLATDEGLDRFDKLTKVREREQRAMAALGRAMRITHQSKYDLKVAGTKARDAGTIRKPWEA